MSKHWEVYIPLRRPSSFPDDISRHTAAQHQIQYLWCWVSGLERVGWLLCPHRTGMFPHPQRIGLLLCPQNAEMCLYPHRVRVLLCSHRARVFAYPYMAGVFLDLHRARVHLYPQRSGSYIHTGLGIYLSWKGRVCLYPHRAGMLPYPHIAYFWWMGENECSSYKSHQSYQIKPVFLRTHLT